MSTTSDELIDQFVRNGECQKILAENGDTLLSKIKFYLQNNFVFILIQVQ